MSKNSPGISQKNGARVKVRKKRPKSLQNSWMVVGFDLSQSSLAGAALGFDSTLNKFKGPVFTKSKWVKNTHYFDKITELARAEDFIHDLQHKLLLNVGMNEIYIAQEEPFPVGMVKRLESQSLKQAAELSGALLAGLLRYGYTNVFQISWFQWAQIVAAELGITIHHSKWNYNSSPNPFKLAPSGKGSGKWRPKEWALQPDFIYKVPNWKDLINHGKHGKIPRPKDSKAKGIQPDDRYDALAVMEWMRREILA